MMFDKPQQSVDEILAKVKVGNVSEDVLVYLGDYIETAVQKLLTQWVNADITEVKSDVGVINFHEQYRQAIRAHLLIKTRMHQNLAAGKSAEKVLNLK